MSYALQAIIGEFLKVLLLLILFVALGQVRYFFLSFIILTTIRSFAGGYHAQNFRNCLIYSIFFFLVAVEIGIFMSDFIIHYRFIIISISLGLILVYAPVPSIQRPITNRNRYVTLKILAIIVTLLWAFILLKLNYETTLISTGIFTVLLESIQLIIKRGKQE